MPLDLIDKISLYHRIHILNILISQLVKAYSKIIFILPYIYKQVRITSE